MGRAGMVAYHCQHLGRHRQRELDADLGVVGRADHRDRVLAAAPLAGQQVAILFDIVAGGEHLIGDFFPFHAK